MFYSLSIPGPADDIAEMRVLQWHAAEGERIVAGALLVELETHKAIIEVRACRDAVLRRIECPEGVWGAAGRLLASLSDEPDEPFPSGGMARMEAEFEIC